MFLFCDKVSPIAISCHVQQFWQIHIASAGSKATKIIYLECLLSFFFFFSLVVGGGGGSTELLLNQGNRETWHTGNKDRGFLAMVQGMVFA